MQRLYIGEGHLYLIEVCPTTCKYAVCYRQGFIKKISQGG